MELGGVRETCVWLFGNRREYYLYTPPGGGKKLRSLKEVRQYLDAIPLEVDDSVEFSRTLGEVESMEEIMQLERVTVAAGTMGVAPDANASVVGLCRRMRQCWISTIGYRVKQAPRKIVVCDKYRSFVINVQGGSRGPKPNT
jgi:hypothetical protein